MTLKEKFYISKQSTNRFRDEESNYCEKIADEFAIGFGKFCIGKVSDFLDDKGDQTDGQEYSMEELLEIYKKEQGL